ncbi:MAG: glutathione S-transferase family protein [Marinicellaceae bacterium]
MIKLYQFPISHYCEKIRWTLDYKDIEYEKINLLPGLHIKTTTRLAKTSSVPLLIDGDHKIQNSEDIITYLEDKYPQKSLTPKDEVIKQQALEWEKYADKELGIHVRRVCYHILLDRPDIVIPFFTHEGPWYGTLLMKLGFNKLQSKMRYFMKINDDTFKESLSRMERAIEKIHNHLQSNAFLAGDEFSRADLAAASLLAPLCQADGYGLDWPKNTPKELLEIAEKHEAQLHWVHDFYTKYR